MSLLWSSKVKCVLISACAFSGKSFLPFFFYQCFYRTELECKQLRSLNIKISLWSRAGCEIKCLFLNGLLCIALENESTKTAELCLFIMCICKSWIPFINVSFLCYLVLVCLFRWFLSPCVSLKLGGRRATQPQLD